MIAELSPKMIQDLTDRAFPLVTIVTPSFNQGQFIRDTIESVLSQDYPAIEYIVMDGGSTDDTVSILESYGDRLRWVSEPDRGQAHAVNKGWRRANGEILAWINSDDIWLPGAVATAVDYLVAHPEVGMVYGEADLVDQGGRVIRRYPTYPFEQHRPMERCGICQPTVFIRQGVVAPIGYLNEALHYCMDYEMWIRIARHSSIGYVPNCLAHSRWHDECKTIKHRMAAQRETMEMVYTQYKFVPPGLLGFYAREFVNSTVNHSIPLRRLVIILRMVPVALREFWRYNRRLPWSEFRHWATGLLKGVKKVWTEL